VDNDRPSHIVPRLLLVSVLCDVVDKAPGENYLFAPHLVVSGVPVPLVGDKKTRHPRIGYGDGKVVELV
jgi:hypothetical protein